jgi:hypothetical protein
MLLNASKKNKIKHPGIKLTWTRFQLGIRKISTTKIGCMEWE